MKWKKPRGIQSVFRVGKRGRRPNVKVGYGSNKKTRFMRPNGFYTMLVHNVDELDMLLMQNRVFNAEIAHGVSFKTRQAILERAAELDVGVTNANARIRTEEA